MHTRTALGCHAEDLVAQHLADKGFMILEQNYKKNFGEIDVIARNKNLLVFVEVKMRTNNYFDLAEVITPSKQQKIIRVASEYLAKHHDENFVCRFDVDAERHPHIGVQLSLRRS